MRSIRKENLWLGKVQWFKKKYLFSNHQLCFKGLLREQYFNEPYFFEKLFFGTVLRK